MMLVHVQSSSYFRTDNVKWKTRCIDKTVALSDICLNHMYASFCVTVLQWTPIALFSFQKKELGT